jgi:DNA-binding response OmpR family regulator
VQPVLVLVEDHVLVRQTYADALRRAGWRVIERPSARDLVELVRREKPSSVILDVSLPGPSGTAACSAIKHERDIAHTQVILLTAHDSFETRHAAATSGADRFFVKPVPPVELLHALR